MTGFRQGRARPSFCSPVTSPTRVSRLHEGAIARAHRFGFGFVYRVADNPHSADTEAGMCAHRDGGNAIYAAIAAGAVLAVVHPHNVSLRGDLDALVRTPDSAERCISASGWAAGGVDVVGLRARIDGSCRSRRRRDHCSRGVPVASSLSAHLAHPQNAALFDSHPAGEVARPIKSGIRRNARTVRHKNCAGPSD